MTPRRSAKSLLLVLPALVAGALLGGGVTPGEAARAVQRALNADKVDGLSASRTPSAGKLLALDRNKRFPSSVVPQARGPRGLQGPSGTPGTPGERGPSEAYVARNNAGIDLSPAPIEATQLRLVPGAYVLDFAAHTYLRDPGTFVDCSLTANGGPQFVKTAARVGGDADSTIEGALVMNDAMTFSETTTVRAMCSERVDSAVKMTDVRLRAIRVGSVTVQ